ncbi:MAG TPA: class I SAM-dependent methyltransferase [Patescibacteria group bacterium]|nr:class I SAM-dependent methyltransferase [Patescibacteria group bacterium]
MNLSKFYNDKIRLGYHPIASVNLKRGFLKSLVSYDDRFVTVIKYLEKLIAGLYKKEKIKVLDIGIGDGVYERLLSAESLHKVDLYGIDISKNQIKRAEKFIKEGKVVDLDNQNIPYKSNTFDLIIISEILEHVFYPENILNEAYRVLRSGGKMLITFPNSGALQLRLSLFLTGRSPLLNYTKNKEHIRFFDKGDVLTAFITKPKVLYHQGLSSFVFDKWDFPVKIITPRIAEIIGNIWMPRLALGNLLILKK